MSSAPLLQLLATQARLSDGELAERLDMTEEAVRAQREQWEREGIRYFRTTLFRVLLTGKLLPKVLCKSVSSYAENF